LILKIKKIILAARGNLTAENKLMDKNRKGECMKENFLMEARL
jgi:hypothetical protein